MGHTAQRHQSAKRPGRDNRSDQSPFLFSQPVPSGIKIPAQPAAPDVRRVYQELTILIIIYRKSAVYLYP